MTTLRAAVISFVVLVVGFSGWLVMASTLTFEQTDCIYKLEKKYLWIKLHNGVEDKGIRFASDGIVFESPVFGLSTASRYGSVVGLEFDQVKEDFGVLVVKRKSGESEVKSIEIGRVQKNCWDNLKQLMSSNPLSQHVDLID